MFTGSHEFGPIVCTSTCGNTAIFLLRAPSALRYTLLNRKFPNPHNALYGPGNKSAQFLCDIPVIRLTRDVDIDCELVLPMERAVKKVRQHEFQESGAPMGRAAKKSKQ